MLVYQRVCSITRGLGDGNFCPFFTFSQGSQCGKVRCRSRALPNRRRMPSYFKGCGSMGFANKGDKRNNKVDLMYVYIYVCRYIYIYITLYYIYIYTSLHILQIRNALFWVLQCFLLGETWRNQEKRFACDWLLGQVFHSPGTTTTTCMNHWSDRTTRRIIPLRKWLVTIAIKPIYMCIIYIYI